MQVKTIWQPAYTPPKLIMEAPKPIIEREPRNFKRAYLSFGRSKTAQKVLHTIKSQDGVTAMNLIMQTKLVGVGQYIRTLSADGLLTSKMMPVSHTRQKVRHYWSAE